MVSIAKHVFANSLAFLLWSQVLPLRRFLQESTQSSSLIVIFLSSIPQYHLILSAMASSPSASDDTIPAKSIQNPNFTSSSTNAILESLDPYYVHPNENPTLVLVSPILEGPNYHSWALAMTMTLGMKNKFAFVDGSIQKPAISDPNFPLWKTCSWLVLSWINHSVSNEISSSILSIPKAYEVWKELKNRLSQGDHVRISQIQHDIFSLQQGTMSVSAYYRMLNVTMEC